MFYSVYHRPYCLPTQKQTQIFCYTVRNAWRGCMNADNDWRNAQTHGGWFSPGVPSALFQAGTRIQNNTWVMNEEAALELRLWDPWDVRLLLLFSLDQGKLDASTWLLEQLPQRERERLVFKSEAWDLACATQNGNTVEWVLTNNLVMESVLSMALKVLAPWASLSVLQKTSSLYNFPSKMYTTALFHACKSPNTNVLEFLWERCDEASLQQMKRGAANLGIAAIFDDPIHMKQVELFNAWAQKKQLTGVIPTFQPSPPSQPRKV